MFIHYSRFDTDICDGGDKRIQRSIGRGFGNACIFRHLFNQFRFCHVMVSFLGVGLEFRNMNTKVISSAAVVVALSAKNKVGFFHERLRLSSTFHIG
jgi:hypothetical protein